MGKLAPVVIREQANGYAYICAGVVILFRHGCDPDYVCGDELVPIARPERFGAHGTPAERRAFVRLFAGRAG